MTRGTILSGCSILGLLMLLGIQHEWQKSQINQVRGLLELHVNTHTWPNGGKSVTSDLKLVSDHLAKEDKHIASVNGSVADVNDKVVDLEKATDELWMQTFGTPRVASTAAPTPAPPPSPTSAPTPSPTPAPTPAPTPSPTPAPTPAPTPSPTPAPTPSPTPAPTPACHPLAGQTFKLWVTGTADGENLGKWVSFNNANRWMIARYSNKADALPFLFHAVTNQCNRYKLQSMWTGYPGSCSSCKDYKWVSFDSCVKELADTYSEHDAMPIEVIKVSEETVKLRNMWPGEDRNPYSYISWVGSDYDSGCLYFVPKYALLARYSAHMAAIFKLFEAAPSPFPTCIDACSRMGCECRACGAGQSFTCTGCCCWCPSKPTCPAVRANYIKTNCNKPTTTTTIAASTQADMNEVGSVAVM